MLHSFGTFYFNVSIDAFHFTLGLKVVNCPKFVYQAHLLFYLPQTFAYEGAPIIWSNFFKATMRINVVVSQGLRYCGTFAVGYAWSYIVTANRFILTTLGTRRDFLFCNSEQDNLVPVTRITGTSVFLRHISDFHCG